MTINKDGTALGLRGAMAPPAFEKKKLIAYIFTQKIYFKLENLILGPPSPKNWQDDS